MKDTLLVCRVFLSLSLVCRGSKSLRITGVNVLWTFFIHKTDYAAPHIYGYFLR
jgi:hypothetical protein